MATRMQQRRGTLAEWTAANPILLEGEIGWEKDTGYIRVGDGVRHFLSLPKYAGPQGPSGPQGPQGPQGATGPPSTIAGPQGPQGAQGAQGAKGSDSTAVGSPGPQGPQGPTGPQGAAGTPGAPGADSTVAGPQGPQGAPGPGGLLTGMITLWATGSAPAGYLLCDGAALSRTTYAALFAVIGTTYGAGDGSSTFNIPNFKGRVVVGYDAAQGEFNALGKTGGEKTHVLTTAEMPAHNHGGTSGSGSAPHSHTFWWERLTDTMAGGVNGRVTDITGQAGGSGTNYTSATSGATEGTSHTHSIPSQGTGTGHNVLQPYNTVNYIIKA